MTEVAGSVALDAMIAGFIVWLARQRAPLLGRRHCPNTVERFLRWQHLRREQGEDHTEDAYCAELRRTAIGPFKAEDAGRELTLDQIAELVPTTAEALR